MSAAARSQQKPIVFVVDDDISVRESLELLIEFAGWKPETFALAEEFLARAPAHRHIELFGARCFSTKSFCLSMPAIFVRRPARRGSFVLLQIRSQFCKQFRFLLLLGGNDHSSLPLGRFAASSKFGQRHGN